jgi:hypothetical protein
MIQERWELPFVATDTDPSQTQPAWPWSQPPCIHFHVHVGCQWLINPKLETCSTEKWWDAFKSWESTRRRFGSVLAPQHVFWLRETTTQGHFAKLSKVPSCQAGWRDHAHVGMLGLGSLLLHTRRPSSKWCFIVCFVVLSKSEKANFHGTGKFPLHCAGGEMKNYAFSCASVYTCYVIWMSHACGTTGTTHSLQHVQQCLHVISPPTRGWWSDCGELTEKQDTSTRTDVGSAVEENTDRATIRTSTRNTLAW